MDTASYSWPNLGERYDAALRLAVDFVAGRFDAAGIVAAGSIIRGCGHATSDLDLYVICGGELSQRLSKWFNGVPAEIFVNPPDAIEAHMAREQEARTPITAHMFATGFPVLSKDGVVERFRERATALLAAAPQVDNEALVWSRYSAGNLYEDACDIAAHDPAAADLLLARAIHQMCQHVFLARGLFYPRAKDLVTALEKLDPAVALLVRAYSAATTLHARLDLAGQLADATVRTRGFFEFESVPRKLF